MAVQLMPRVPEGALQSKKKCIRVTIPLTTICMKRISGKLKVPDFFATKNFKRGDVRGPRLFGAKGEKPRSSSNVENSFSFELIVPDVLFEAGFANIPGT